MLALFAFEMVQDIVGRHTTRAENTACHACACSAHMTAPQPTQLVSTPVVVQHQSCDPLPVPEQIFVTQFLRPPRLLA